MWERIVSWWEENRTLGVALWFLVAALLFGLIFGEGSPLRPKVTAEPSPSTAALNKILDEAERNPPPPPETPQEEAKRIVQKYEEEVAAAPEDPDAPVKLVAAGNLYLERMNDPESAAGAYKHVISRYPDWTGAPGAYRQLVKALDLSGNQMERVKVLMEMTEKFPVDSPDYQYAQAQLALGH